MQESVPFTSISLMFATCAASMTALYWLFSAHIAGRPLLPYEPRKNVPWGAGTAGIAFFFTSSAVLASLLSSSAIPHGEHPTQAMEQSEHATMIEEVPASESEGSRLAAEEAEPEEASPALGGLVTIAFVLGITWLAIYWLRIGCGADVFDLGLPLNGEQLWKDVRIGAIACLAAFLPIYLVQFSLTFLLQPEVEHPLIEQLKETSTLAMFVVSVFLAVVAAPLSEEVFFRLILQGWLEKWEDRAIGFQSIESASPSIEIEIQSELPDNPSAEAMAAAVEVTSVPVPEQFSLVGDELPMHGAVGQLPHGWFPILVSGSMFGLAHLGQGVAPAALVIFGIVLGYVYQRTHRIVPTITAHALFNGYSMLMLWLQMS